MTQIFQKKFRRWWTGFAAFLLATLVAEFFITKHPHFGMDGTVFFYAWFGFASCAGIVVFSKLLGVLLKRPVTYYDEKGNG